MAAPPGLGYRGVLCHEGAAVTVVYGGWIRVGDRLFADPNRTIERWLLGTLPPELAELRPVIESGWGES